MKLLSSVLVSMTVALAGCGAIYISPSVQTGTVAGSTVDVVAMTPANIALANASSYHARSLPSAFYANAGAGGAPTGAGALPDGPNSRQVRPSALQMRLPPESRPQPYLIGVGDVLRLVVPEDGPQTYTVQDDGAIAIPDVGRVEVAEKSLSDAEAALFQQFVGAQIDPAFALDIAEFNSRRVSVGGSVGAPSVLPITLTPLHLDEALARAGGLEGGQTSTALIRIFRDGQLYQLPASELFGPRGIRKIVLQPGDSVFVDSAYDLGQAEAYFAEQIQLAQTRQSARLQALRELETEINLRRAALEEVRSTFQQRLELGAVDRDYAYITGEVTRQTRFALPFGSVSTLADALYDEGGFSTETGNPSQIYILRGNDRGDRITAWQLDARNAASLVLATRMELRPNDIIFIAEQPVTRWNRVVQQIVPSLINTSVNAASQ